MTILDALRDPQLLGGLPKFRDLSTWTGWLVFIAAVYGLPFSDLGVFGLTEVEALTRWTTHTGRTVYSPPAGGFPEAFCICGVQSGKSTTIGALATYEAATAAPGTTAAIVGQDSRAAMRSIWRNVAEPFDVVPAFKAEVTRRTQDTIELTGDRALALFPCRVHAMRGLRASIVVCDELAFYRGSEGQPTDLEMLRTARGRVATTGGKVVTISSPYAASGALYEAHRRHFAKNDSPTLVWQASAPEMNPTLPADYLERMERDDPEAFASEVAGQFRSGVAAFLDPEAIDSCIDRGVRERPVWNGLPYTASFDASGGRTDAAALAIAHREGDRAVLDVVRAWPSPHNPSAVIAEAADTLARFGVRVVSGDNFGAQFVTEGFAAHAIRYEPSGLDRSGTYLNLLPLITSGRAVLLDDAPMLRELRGLERRRGTSGRDRIDHRVGAHDDRAVAVAGALVAASARQTLTGLVW